MNQSDCRHERKNGFYMTISNNQLCGWTEKKLQTTSQSQTCTKKWSRSLFGGLLPVWPTVAFWIPVKPLHLRGMLSKSMRYILKTAMPAAGIGQQKDPNSSPWQCPTACCTINASRIEWNQATKFCLICHIHLTSRPLTTTSSSILTTFAGKMLPQLAGCRKCFPRVHQIPKHIFLCYRNKQIYSSLGKLCWLPKMVEEWDGETTFSPTNSSKDHLNAEQTPQNNFWTLAEDTRHPERQPIVFKKGGRTRYKR